MIMSTYRKTSASSSNRPGAPTGECRWERTTGRNLPRQPTCPKVEVVTPNATRRRLEDYKDHHRRLTSSQFVQAKLRQLEKEHAEENWDEYEQGYIKKDVECDDWSNIDQKPLDHPDNHERAEQLMKQAFEINGEDREILIKWLVRNARSGIKSCSTPVAQYTCMDKRGREYESSQLSFLKLDRADYGVNDILIRVTNLTYSLNEYEPKVYQFTRGQMEWALRGLFKVYKNKIRRIIESSIVRRKKASKDTRYSCAQSLAYEALRALYNLHEGITWRKYQAIRDLTAPAYLVKRCLKNEIAYEYIALRELYPDIDKSAEEEHEKEISSAPSCIEVVAAPRIFVANSEVIESVKLECREIPAPICATIARTDVTAVDPRRVSVCNDQIIECFATKSDVDTTECSSCDEKDFSPVILTSKSENVFDIHLVWPLRAGEMDILYEYVDSCTYVDDCIKILKKRVFTNMFNKFIRESFSAYNKEELKSVRFTPYRLLSLCRDNYSLFVSLCKPVFVSLNEQLPVQDENMEVEEATEFSVNSFPISSPNDNVITVVQKHLQFASSHNFACCCAECVKRFIRRSRVSSWYRQLIDFSYDEIDRPVLVAQMAVEENKEDPECVENLEKHANITFVDEREKLSDATHLNSNFSARDPNADVADTNWSLRDILTRDRLIHRLKWSVKDVPGYVIKTSVPYLWHLNAFDDIQNMALRFIGYLRAGVSYRIAVNGTKFHCGRLICYFRPVSFSDQFVDVNNLTMYPHVFLDASVSNSAELFVPFSSIFSYFPTVRDHYDDTAPMYMGSLNIAVWSQLAGATGASTELNVVVYSRYVNPEVHQMQNFKFDKTVIHALMPVTQAKEDDEQPVVLRTTQPLCHGDLANHHAIRLGLSKSDSSILNSAIKGSNDAFNLSALLQQYTLLTKGKWSKQTVSNIGQIPVTPVYVPRFEAANATKHGYSSFIPSMVAYCARMFAYWRGSLVYKIQVINTQFHSGRLAVTFVPNSNTALVDITSITNFNTIVFDLQEKSEIEFTVPFMSIRPWLRCDHFFNKQYCDTDNGSKYSSGLLYITVINTLVHPDNVVSEVDVLVYIRAGNDLEFNVPVSLETLYLNPPKGKNSIFMHTYCHKMLSKTVAFDPIIEAREYIVDLFLKGQQLLRRNLIVKPKGDSQSWPFYVATNLGKFYPEVHNWLTRASLLREYETTGIQWQFIRALGDYFEPPKDEYIPQIRNGVSAIVVKLKEWNPKAMDDKITAFLASFETFAASVSARMFQFSPHIGKLTPIQSDTNAEVINTTDIRKNVETLTNQSAATVDQLKDVVERLNYQNGKLNTLDDNVQGIKTKTDLIDTVVKNQDMINDSLKILPNVNEKLNSIQSDTFEMRSSNANISNNTRVIMNSIGTIDTNVQNISTDTSTISSTCNDIESAVSNLSQDIASIADNTDGLYDALTSIDKNTLDTKTACNSIDVEIPQITDKCKTISNDIKEYFDFAKPHISILNSISDNVSDIKQDNFDIKTNVVAMAKDVKTVQGDIDGMVDEMVAIIDQLTDNIGPNIGKITDNTNKVGEKILQITQDIASIKDYTNHTDAATAIMRVNTGLTVDHLKDHLDLMKPTNVNVQAIRDKIAPSLEAQSKVETFVANDNQRDPQHLMITKGFRHSNVNSNTIGESAMNIRSVLHRFYCVYNSPEIDSIYDYTLFSFPVSPVNTVYTRKNDLDSVYSEFAYSSHLSWFSSLYTYWHGSLKYRLVYDANSEVVVLHHPTCVRNFYIEYGVSPITLQQLESYATAMAVSKTQNAIEVEVPFMSPFNQLLVAKDLKKPYMYTQNGSLLVAIRAKLDSNAAPLHFSLFQAAGSNFDLNIHRPVPMVYQPSFGYKNKGLTDKKYNYEKGLDFMHSWLEQNPNVTLPTYCDDITFTDQTCEAYSAEEYREMHNQDTMQAQMGMLDYLPGFDSVKRMHNTIENFNEASNNLKDLTSTVNNFVNPPVNGSTIVNNYASIAVNVLMVYTLVDCFKEIFSQPTVSNFIKFGTVFASIIGYNFSHSLKLILTQLTSWCVNECTIPRSQSLNGDMADMIEGIEERIVPILAVLGTIVYAYVFGIIPKLSELKQWIRSFFESDEVEKKLKTQSSGPSDWLKNAHFSFMGLTAIGKIYDKFCEYVQMFINWLLDRENPEIAAQRKAGEYKEELLSLIKEIDELDYDPIIEEAFKDPLVHNRFYSIMDRANHLHHVFVTNPSADKYILSIVRETRTRALKLLQRLEKEKPTSTCRYAPFLICVAGETGTGKTQCIPDLIHSALDAIKAPRHNRIYNHSITKDGFWNGYKNQTAVAWDEFGQSTQADDVVPEILTLCGNEPYQVNMAALEDKGRYFTSQVIVMTTNVPYERFATTLRHPDAFLRRRNYMVGVQLREGTVEDCVKRVGFDPEYSHCVYARMDPMTNRVIKPNMTFIELKQDIAREMKLWDEKQKNILSYYNSVSSHEVLPRGLCVVKDDDDYINPERRLWDDDSEDEFGEKFDQPETQADHHIVQCTAKLKIGTAMGDGDCFYHSMIALGFDFKSPRELREDFARKSNFPVALQSNVLCDVVTYEHWATDETLEAFADCYNICLCVHRNSEKQCERLGVGKVYHLQYSGNAVGGHYSPLFERELAKVEVKIVKDKKVKLTAAEKFERDCFLQRLRSLDESDKSVLIDKLIKRENKCQNYWFYNKCRKYLNSLSSKILDWFNNNSKLATVLGCIILLSSAGALLLRHDSSNLESGHACDPKHIARRIVVSEKGYTCDPKGCCRRIVKAEMMQPQGCEDMNAFNLKTKIHQALVPVSWNNESGISGSVMASHIGGTVILLPWHFFRQAKDGHHFWLKHRYNYVDIEYQSKNLVRLRDYDWVLYDCGPRLEPRKMLIKYFISEQDLSRVKKLPSLFVAIDDDGERVMQFNPEAKFSGQSTYVGQGETFVQRGWNTLTCTKSGDCGALHIGLSNALPCPGKIIGMHVAGLPDKTYGFAVLVTREQLFEAWQQIQSKEPQVIGMPIPSEVREPQSLSDMRLIPEGDYSLYGVMPPHLSPAQPQKTNFIETPFVNLVKPLYPMTRKPCHLKPFYSLETGERLSPLKSALTKYGKQTLTVSSNKLDKIESFISAWLEEMELIEDRRVFTEAEAIVGIPGLKEFDPINMKSSPGWPYQVRRGVRKTGKYHLFDENWNISDVELRERLDAREQEAKRSCRVASVWRDCLKDQLMSVEKVEKGKARLFTIPPVDFTILVRKYFLAFSANFYHNHNSFFHAVGITPESYEWTRLYHYLLECTDNVVAGDFGTYDGTLMPELLFRTVRIINNWYNDSEENQNVRRVIGSEIIHTMQLVENCVYASHQGNPSGNPLTVIVNSICNLFYMLIAWLEIMPDKTLDDFRQNCRIVVYGDDNLITVKPSCKEYNQNSITRILSKYNIEYQSDAKDGVAVPDFRKLMDVTFLKRGFRIDKEISKNIVLPFLSKDTLYSYLYWYRKSDDAEEQLQANARSALNFASFHGKEFYEQYFSVWQKCMKSVEYRLPHVTYEEWRDIFLFSCDLPKCESKFMEVTNHPLSRAAAWLIEAPVYYLCAAFGIGKLVDTVEHTDERWAVAIPSGEGKSYLCRKFPNIFVDHDDLLLPAFKVKGVLKHGQLPWSADQARQYDFPDDDRRILLVHHPSNTNRQIIGSFITHFPTFIRINALQRLLLDKTVKMSMNERNAFLLEFARQHEPTLFAGKIVDKQQPLDRRKRRESKFPNVT